MPLPKGSASVTIECATHGSHAPQAFAASRTLSVDQLTAWLANSRRVTVRWDLITGLRQERQARVPLGLERARRYAEALWLRYCQPAPVTWAELAAHHGMAASNAEKFTKDGLLFLRDAFRPPYGSTPPDVQPGTRLAVALYGCDWQPAHADRTAAQSTVAAPHGST